MFCRVRQHISSDELIDTDASERSERIQSRINQYREDIRWLMGSQSGRRILWKWLQEMRFFMPVIDTNGLAQSHKAGAQAVGMKIASELLEASTDQFTLMIKESNDRDTIRNSRN